MTADPVAALRSFLLADTTVTNLVAQRIYGGEVPEKNAKTMPQPCVVLKPSGGAGAIGQGNAEYGDIRIDVFSYGATFFESWSVYLAVYTALKHLTRVKTQSVLLHWVQPLAKGAQGRDPETQWPLTLSSWNMLASEVAAA